MNKKILLIPLALLLAISLVTIGCPAEEEELPPPPPPEEEAPPEEEEEETRTIVCSHYMSPTAFVVQQWTWWAEQVTAQTNGRIQFKWFHGGSMSKPGEEREHCRVGLADMVGMSCNWHSTEMALWEMNGALPFQPADTVLGCNAKLALYDEFPELRAEVESANQRVMFLCPYGDFCFFSREPLKTLDDLEGLTVGCLGTQQPKWLEPVGALPKGITGADAFLNLEKGVVDACIMGGIANCYTYRFHEVTKYLYISELGQYMSYFNTMNLDTWNSFSLEDQQLMDDLAYQCTFEFAARYLEEQDALIKQELLDDWGFEIYTISKEDKVRWAESLPNLARAWADEGANEAEIKLRERMFNRFLEICEEGGHEWPMDWSL